MIYALILRLRHLFFDLGWAKSTPTEVPSVCVGNVAVGGTGKTPMTELIIKTLQDGEVEAADSEIYGFCGADVDFPQRNIAVLSRGYKRKTRGFQQVVCDGTAAQYGDEPLQIKRKFPMVTVVVDENRVEGAAFLADPEKINALKPRKKARILNPEFKRPDIIILDDAFQHRKIKANGSIVLTTYERPFSKDSLMPLGRLRDLRSRAYKADMIAVTKCPLYVGEQEKAEYASLIGLKDYDPQTCTATTPKGKEIKLVFATTVYDRMLPVFPDGDAHYIHAQMAVLVTGIANNMGFVGHMGDSYRIIGMKEFGDHHSYSRSDIRAINDMARHNPLAVVVTTEKDAQRIKDADVPEELRKRFFYESVRTQMLTAAEQRSLKEFLLNL